jgi:predicted aconitase with swiveling domain
VVEEFDKMLVSAFVNAGIPLFKLENKVMRAFLEQFTVIKIKDESYYRRKHYQMI